MPDITWYLNKAPKGGIRHPAYANVTLNENEIFTYHKPWAKWINNRPNPTEKIIYNREPTLEEALQGQRTYVDIWVAPNPQRPIRWTKIVIDETLSGCVFAEPDDSKKNGKIINQGIVIHKGRRRKPSTLLNISKFLGRVTSDDTEIKFRYKDRRPVFSRDENDTVFKFDLYIEHPKLGSAFLHEKFLPDRVDVIKIDPIIHNDGSGPPP